MSSAADFDGSVAISNGFDTKAFDPKAFDTHHHHDPPTFQPEPPSVGMSFENMAAAKTYITDWCSREKIQYSVWKADRRCWVLTCKDKNNCAFRLRVKNTERPVISILEAHTCSTLSGRRTAQTGGPIKATPYDWPLNAHFQPQSTAFVLIDMQRDFCAPEGLVAQQGEDITVIRKTIPGLQRLLFAFRNAGFPIYHTREGHRPDLSTLSAREAFRSQNTSNSIGIGYPGPLGRFMIRGEPGHDIIQELYPHPGEPIIDKPGRSAFSYTDFELLLRIKNIQNLVFAGIGADIGVSSTIRDAAERGFDCLLVEDGTLAKETRMHKAACESIALGGELSEPQQGYNKSRIMSNFWVTNGIPTAALCQTWERNTEVMDLS